MNEAEVGSMTLPIMVNIVPPRASLPFDVVVSFSVTGGTATSKSIVVHTCTYNLSSFTTNKLTINH